MPRDSVVSDAARPRRTLPVGAATLVLALTATVLSAACRAPAQTRGAQLQPTLTFGGAGSIAMQSGIPVPTFALQPRVRLDLAGAWRFQPAVLDQDLSLARRPDALAGLLHEAAGREKSDYDDRSWARLQVPGTFRPARTGGADGGWYRLSFKVSGDWADQAVTLKFAAANYIADVWLNGQYLGYHEGGSTPFAFDGTQQLRANALNVLAVRVDDPEFGSRNDVVPWGIVDWWSYGGLTGDVWFEATDNLLVARADVTPYLDRADIAVVLENRGRSAVASAALDLAILPAAVTADNLLDPDSRHLVPALSVSLGSARIDAGQVQGRSASRYTTSFALSHPDLWRPERPSLYVLHVSVRRSDAVVDDLYETFAVRRIQVDPQAPRLLLNGEAVALRGVAMQDEQVLPGTGGLPAGGPVTTLADAHRVLQQVRDVHADFIRTDHRPANPLLLLLADRMGFGIWEEIPLYHFTPETFGIAMGRGIPQQMLSEMALRDFNHGSVLFHGLANESSGQSERAQAVDELHALDRRLDGSRLTGQAMYGSEPSDPTSRALDVAGYTFYHGVFYGSDPLTGTLAALATAHLTYPRKPILALEFGRWSDSAEQDALQAEIFRNTYTALFSQFDTLSGGYVGGVAWWALNDYWTSLPGITIERFGLFRPDGSARPVALALAELYSSEQPGRGPDLNTVSGGRATPVQGQSAGTLLAYAAYGLAIPSLLVILVTALVVLAGRRRRGGAR